jgi:hypothetical protein
MTEPLADRRKRSASTSGETARVATTVGRPRLGPRLPAIPGLAVGREDGAWNAAGAVDHGDERAANPVATSVIARLAKHGSAMPAPRDPGADVRRTPVSAATTVIRRDFDFVGKGIFAEPLNFDADVVQAISRSKTFRADILTARQAITALTTKAVRAAGLAELKRIEKFVDTWEGTKVPLTKRQEVVDQVATTTSRLAEIADDYTEKDATAQEVEAKRIKAQKRKDEQEKERRQKADLRATQEKEALARAAQQTELAAAEKIASNRSRLDERGVLPAAETVAKAKAQAETADAEVVLRADHARAQKHGSTGGKKAASQKLAEGLAGLETQRTELANHSLGVLANFTTTAAARGLEAADLAWVIETAGVDPGRARGLANVINASGKDRTVVRGLAGLSGDELTTTAQHCVALFQKSVPASSVLAGAQAMTKSPEVRDYVSSAGAKLIPGYLALADIAAPKELKEALAFDLQTPGTAYTPALARRLLVGLAPKKPKQQAIYWLTDRKATPEFVGLVDLFIDPIVDIEALRSVFKAATGVYDAAETLGLCQRHRADLADLATLAADGQPGCPDYTDRVMATRKRNRFGEPHQLAALRAVALLAANSAKVTVTIGQQPVVFGRGQDNQYRQQNEDTDAKTGFVQMAFTDLAGYFEIHTHWGQNEDGRIYSMHVEYGGSNGIEIHTDKVFRPLIDKVVELHNAHYLKPDGAEFYA